MTLLVGVHGTVATILICALLFIDEAGVPLPFAPNEALLIVAGLLMATGGLSPFEFYPFALIAMAAGVMTGYSWARALGANQLRALAARLRGARMYDRVSRRMQRARPWDIGVARMIPGVRVYTTLVCGAAHVDRRTFALGALPATVLWCSVCTMLGVLVGVPAERLFSQVQQLLFSGGVYIALALFSVLAARHVPSSEPRVQALRTVPHAGRVALALGVDLGIVASFVAGVDRITRYWLHTVKPSERNDIGVMLGVVAIAYLLASRRIPGVTAGEGMFGVRYQTLPLRWRVRMHRHAVHGPDAHVHIEPVVDDPVEHDAETVAARPPH